METNDGWLIGILHSVISGSCCDVRSVRTATTPKLRAARYTEMLQGGMNGHISKPLYLEDLKDRIIQII